MKKIATLIIIFYTVFAPKGFAQIVSDGSYLWNSTNITYSINDKTELVLSNKDHYSNQIDRLEYFHFDLIAYHKISDKFSLGLGLRQTESYKSDRWNPGQTYMFYGVYLMNPGNVKIKFANRITSKVYKTSDTQYGLDNITNVDFFVRSTNKWPKPYLMDEFFSNLKLLKLQTFRLYGGFRLIKTDHLGIDLFYCFWLANSESSWKNFNVYGLNTKFRI
ncbi:MAG: DUF2490 domain-containing protein [Bacteroidota bacterium]|nr:DUF2490 domain-containing protein [Bacteroidota bacterium]